MKVRAEFIEEFAEREANRRIVEAGRRAEMSFVNTHFRKPQWQNRRVSDLREGAFEAMREAQSNAAKRYFGEGPE